MPQTANHSMTISAVADEFWNQAIAAKGLSLKDLLGGEVLDQVREGIAINFDTSSDPDGATWEIRRNPQKHPILVKTGKLKASLTEDGGDGYTIVEDTFLTIGTEVMYAGFHEFGTKKLPIRSFAGVREEKLKEIDETIADGVLDIIFGAE